MRRAVTLTKQKKQTKAGLAEYWVLRWFDVAGKCRSESLGHTPGSKARGGKKALSEREARKKAKEKEIEFDSHPALRTASKMPLKEYTERYFKMRKIDAPESTIKSYKTSVRYLIEYFGETKLIDSITDMDAHNFKTALASNELKGAMKSQRDLNKTSVNLHMRQIKAVFNYAVRDLKILPFNPFASTVEIVKQSARWHYVTQDELEKMLDAATDNFRLMIALCRLAGLRRMEAYHLEWQDVNFDQGKLYVIGKDHWQPKDRETRVIPLCPELQQMLLTAFEAAPEGTVRVCPAVCIDNIDRDIKATIVRAGLKPWTKPLHTLRKSCITDWASRYPIHAVKEWAGHANVTTTEQYYLKVTEDQYNKAKTDSFWASAQQIPQQKPEKQSETQSKAS